MAQVVAHADDLLEIGLAVGLTSYVVIVLLVHHGDEVKAVEVFRRELAGAMIENVSVSLPTLAHTIVWQLAYMPRANASRIDEEFIVEASFRNEVLHDAVSSWRTADIAQADKEYLLHFGCKGSANLGKIQINLVFHSFIRIFAAMFEALKEKYRQFRAWQQQPYRVKPLSEEEHVCTTCGTAFEGNYCPRCGQSSRIGRYSFKKAFLLFLDVWGLGNRGMFRTIRDLILRPGYMIRDYLQGMQMAYFPPFKMFFLLIALGLLVDTGMNIKKENRIESAQVKINESIKKTFDQPDSIYSNNTEKEQEKANLARKTAKETIDSSNEAYDWTIKHLSIVTIIFLLFFSFPLYWFFSKSPAYPGIKYSEFFVAVVYITNMISVYSILVSFFGLSQWLDLAIYILTLIPLKQLSGFSYWRVALNCFVAFILFFGAIFIGSILINLALTFIFH